MKYPNIHQGVFLERPNRFIARVLLDGQTEIVHVKNTGRCQELLQPGAEVYLVRAENAGRKTAYDLVGVRKGDRLINMDSQMPNAAAEEWLREEKLFSPLHRLKREVRFGASRFDFYAEYADKKAFVEVKGVTLEDNGIVRFPDAPTERGVKHLHELMQSVSQGYEAWLLFVIQMANVIALQPNTETHPAFAQTLQEADKAGVHLIAYDCIVTPDSMTLHQSVRIEL